MSTEDNKAIVGRWFTEFWGNPWNPAAFPDLGFGGTAELIAEGDYVVGQWKGGGTHTGDAFDDLPLGSEIGLDDGVTVLKQLGLIPEK